MFGLFSSDKNKTVEEHRPETSVDVSASFAPEPEDIGQVALDVLESEDAVVVVAPLAGVEKDKVDINLSRNILTVSGSRQRPAATEGARTLVAECFFGPFSRSVILPENLGLNKIRASMENNLLVVTIPKLVMGSKSIKIERLSDNA